MDDSSWKRNTVHAGVQGPYVLKYCVLERFALIMWASGEIDAAAAGLLGEIPPKMAAAWGFGTRRAAAMMAKRTVLRGSSGETSDTIPTSQAWDKFVDPCWLTVPPAPGTAGAGIRC